MATTVLLAGSTGMLGNRIAAHLLDQPDVTVQLLIRANDRYPDAHPTGLHDYLVDAHRALQRS